MPNQAPKFEVGKEYKRTELHKDYGGSGQHGISPSKDFPAIFIFTSHSGEQYGYKDEFVDGIFLYTGEGHSGDMQMNRGNKALRDHAKDGRGIYIFESTRKGHVRFLGSAEYIGHHEQIGVDENGNNRKMYVFHLDVNSVDDANEAQDSELIYNPENIKGLKKKSLGELRKLALKQPANKNLSYAQKSQISHYRSEALKLYVLKRSKGICEGCASPAPFTAKNGPYLECHHIHRLADGGPDHPKNVAAICPNCHRRAHYSIDAVEFNKTLNLKTLKLEKIGLLF